MPVTPTYPGVYIEELPSGVHTITGVATSITAFVGYTPQGPVNQAVRIANFGDYQRNFGGLQQNSPVGYAVQQFFLNGGSDAYVVRVAHGAAIAGITVNDSSGTAVMVITAADAGVWGNLVRIELDYQTSNPDGTFNLTVTQFTLQSGKLVMAASENYRNLSMNSLSASYAPNVIDAVSNLINIVVTPGLTVTQAGWALSTDLTTFPNLTASDTTITGFVDTTDPFTLILTSVPANMGQLITALNAAIAAGMPGRLQAQPVGAVGSGAGNFVRLASTNATSTASAVQITQAPSNDLAVKLHLGLPNGGREKEAASVLRPVPTGTTSADVADVLASPVGGASLDVTVTDRSSGAVLLTLTTLAIPATTSAAGLRDSIRAAIQGIPNSPSTAQASVQLYGTLLNVTPSADTPNASITLGNALAGTLRLTGAGSFENVQEYSLGTGASFGAQTAAQAGLDGTPPTGTDILGSFAAKTGIYALRDVDLFNLLCIPDTVTLPSNAALSVLAEAMSFCEDRRAFLIVDPDPSRVVTNIGDWVGTSLQASKNAAVFFPTIQVADPLQNFRIHSMPSSGAIAGVFARTDAQRGVWKAPAGVDAIVQGAQGLSSVLTDAENGDLNPLGINCLRTFPVYGTVVWGSRTLFGSDARADEWKYTPVRRTALFIEESLYRGTKWVVFEPNDEPLWAQIRLNVGAFMQTLFRQGAFQGKTPQQAYFVKCDSETTTPTDQSNGIVNILVGFAPLKPAEFVIIQIQQMAGQTAA